MSVQLSGYTRVDPGARGAFVSKAYRSRHEAHAAFERMKGLWGGGLPYIIYWSPPNTNEWVVTVCHEPTDAGAATADALPWENGDVVSLDYVAISLACQMKAWCVNDESNGKDDRMPGEPARLDDLDPLAVADLLSRSMKDPDTQKRGKS